MVDKKFSNHLVTETSPYLLQHAHNPVDWYPWGEVALQRAKDEGKVILVSIGYSACHWCHVMEKESFENEETAAIMNEGFINIKIDREERPDLDHIYMDAVQAMSGSGGWPLNVFLTPDAKPFFGGTYFPPVKAFNRSSWTEVLGGVSQAWKERKNEIEAQAENLTAHLTTASNFIQQKENFDDEVFTADQAESMFEAIMKSADKAWGGFGSAPKFPQTFTIAFLLQYHYYTGNEEALKQALTSIDKMLQGGIYDHVGGGLARYSTDREWLAPHFEKMLYDNALFINILCDAYQVTLNQKYSKALRKTIAFVQNELLSEEGGFYAALDADSEGEEGKYYVWQKNEIEDLLGEDSKLFCDFFDVTEEGNWEEKNILRMLKPLEEYVKDNQLDFTATEDIINECLIKLTGRRNERIKPGLDDKIILGWNALMLKAIAKSSIVLEDESFAELAINNFEFLTNKFSSGQKTGLFHTYKNEKAKYPAFLDDYAYLVEASLQLYEINFETRFLETARQYCTYVIEHFSDEGGTFFYYTGKDQHDVIIRKMELYDGAVPSGNAVMANNLHALSIYFGNQDWNLRSYKMSQFVGNAVIQYPGSFGIWASFILKNIIGTNELAITGKNFKKIAKKIQLNYIPNIKIMASMKENSYFPLLENKGNAADDKLYLCKDFTCKQPFTEAHALLKEINVTNKIRINKGTIF